MEMIEAIEQLEKDLFSSESVIKNLFSANMQLQETIRTLEAEKLEFTTKPNLGLSTTEQLLDEIKIRVNKLDRAGDF